MSAHDDIKGTSVLPCGPYGEREGESKNRTKVEKARKGQEERRSTELPPPLPLDCGLHTFTLNGHCLQSHIVPIRYDLWVHGKKKAKTPDHRDYPQADQNVAKAHVIVLIPFYRVRARTLQLLPP